MRVVFLIGNYGTGGKERQLTEIIKRLPKDKFQIHLFMKCDNSFYFSSIKSHLTSYFSLDKDHFNLLDILALKQYNKSIQPDVLFSFSTTLSHYAFLLKFFGRFDYRLINGSIRDAPVKFNSVLRMERILYKFYREIVSNSYAGLLAYKQSVKKFSKVLYNGFDMSRIPKKNKYDLRKLIGIDEKFTVIMVGSMYASKDQNSFILAANEVLNLDNDVQFFLIGSGPRKHLYEAQVRSFGIEENVFFKEIVNNVEDFFKASDLSVLTSASWHGEGIPNVVLESLACGTPVIATDNGGTKEILKDNFNGYLINNGDYKTLADKILFLKRNITKLESFSLNGVETVVERFTIEKMMLSFEKIINESIGDRSIFPKSV